MIAKLIALSILALALRMAEFAISGAGLHVDEAQYWVWSHDLDWGYFSKPPLLVALISVSTALFGDSLLGVKSLSMLTWILSSWVLGWLAFRMSTARVGIFTGVLFAATPISGLLGLSVTTDAPLTLFWALCMLCIWEAAHAEGQTKIYWWLACGVAFGLAVLSKYSALALGLSALWLVWICPASHKRSVIWGGLLAGFITLAILLPHLFWSIENHWPTAQHTLDITIRESGSASDSQSVTNKFLSGLEFLLGQALILGPAVWLISVWLIRQKAPETQIQAPRPEHCWNPQSFALSFAVPIILLGLVQALNAKAMVNWAVPMALGVCLWLGLQTDRFQLSTRNFVVFCCLGFALSGAIAIGGDLKQWFGIPTTQGQSKWDIWGRMRGWHEALQSLAPTLNALPETPWVTDDRSTFVHASYELRALNPEIFAWNASGGVYHHFDWKRSWSEHGNGKRFIWVSPNLPHAQLLQQYPQAQRLAVAQSGRVSLQVWLLQTDQKSQ